MNRYLLICLLLTVFNTSCKQRANYRVLILSTTTGYVGGTISKIDTTEIRAENDSLAYARGAEYFILHKQVAAQINSEIFSTYTKSFIVEDKNGVDIGSRLPQKIKDHLLAVASKDNYVGGSSAINQIDSNVIRQQQIAYGSLKFGMKKKDFKKLSLKDTYPIQKIGEIYYSLNTYFDDSSRLYDIEFESDLKDANYIDTDVKEAVNNLKEVIEAKYGKCEFLRTYPSIIDFNSGYITWIYKWTVGTKIIYVGAAEKSSGSEYYAICRIYNEPLYNQNKTAEENRDKALKSNESAKF